MLLAEREREKEKERKKGGETKTEEEPLLRVLRVVRVDTNVFEKIVECILVSSIIIYTGVWCCYGVTRSTFPYFFLNKPLMMEKSGALCTTAS